MRTGLPLGKLSPCFIIILGINFVTSAVISTIWIVFEDLNLTKQWLQLCLTYASTRFPASKHEGLKKKSGWSFAEGYKYISDLRSQAQFLMLVFCIHLLSFLRKMTHFSYPKNNKKAILDGWNCHLSNNHNR